MTVRIPTEQELEASDLNDLKVYQVASSVSRTFSTEVTRSSGNNFNFRAWLGNKLCLDATGEMGRSKNGQWVYCETHAIVNGKLVEVQLCARL